DVSNGRSKLIMEEQSYDGWIDVFNFFAGVDHMFYFPDNSKEFFWISDRDGWSHIYRYDYKGNVKNQVTRGNWEVSKVNAIDYANNRIYYTSTETSPLQRQLFSIRFDGTDKQRLTQEKGTHNISMGLNGKFYIDRYSSTTIPTLVELRSTNEGKLKLLADNKSVLDYIDSHVYAPRELFSFTTSDGQELDGSMIKPINFDSTKSYPLLLNIYGGPSSQGVYNSWESAGWTQYLAQKGFVIVNVNNRGNGGYGRAFEHIVYKQLGKWEAHDFVETAEYMGRKSWVDSTRMAIRGHSSGGYMTTYRLFTHPDVFEVGIATAPVTSWDLYDSIYTERYMGLIKNNREGYNRSSSTEHAANLSSNLLLSHSLMDENVHIQNTMQLMTALTAKAKDVDLRIYPPGAHGVAFNTESYLLLMQSYTNYLMEHLQ